MVYEVRSSYGSGKFECKKDAVLVLQMMGSYEGLAVNRTEVFRALEKDGYFEAFPLCIRECVL
ncbi:MAG: hypothetical protein J6C33_02365 [Lachnospiraceae bacterium]|nr:hypothetical protein [Lachnospiraceae bacterium]